MGFIKKQKKILMDNKIKTDKSSIVSLCFGIASIFLWEFSIIPILAIGFGILAAFRTKNNQWQMWTGIILGLIFLFVRIGYGPINHFYRGTSFDPSSNNGTTQTIAIPPPVFNSEYMTDNTIKTNLAPQPSLPSTSISNPDYLKDTSVYLVDYENKILSSFKDPIWVEEIINSNTLRVSYTITKTGTKILKLQTLSIPWLGDPAEDRSVTQGMAPFQVKSHSIGQCWENGAREYLKKYFLHTRVDLTDIAPFVIKNGYGSVARPSTAYFLQEMKEQHERGIGAFDADTTPSYFSELTDMEGVASLAKRGLWETCPRFSPR